MNPSGSINQPFEELALPSLNEMTTKLSHILEEAGQNRIEMKEHLNIKMATLKSFAGGLNRA